MSGCELMPQQKDLTSHITTYQIKQRRHVVAVISILEQGCTKSSPRGEESLLERALASSAA